MPLPPRLPHKVAEHVHIFWHLYPDLCKAIRTFLVICVYYTIYLIFLNNYLQFFLSFFDLFIDFAQKELLLIFLIYSII